MKTRVNQIVFRGKVEIRDAAASLLSQTGDFVVVDRGQVRMIVMRCPCGCGDDLLINVDKRVGKAWRYYRNQYGMTLFPSYWRDTACKSHFIVWNNNVYWCSGWQTENADKWHVGRELEEAVFKNLAVGGFIKYYDLAERLDVIPWEVLQACRQLIQRGIVESGGKGREDEFKRVI